jgi:predicted porin
MATGAMAAGPTIYGKVNKELRYMTQEDDFETKSKFTSVRDVRNSHSRIGVKGDMDLENGMKGIYQIEMGVVTQENTDEYAGADTGIYNRLAMAGLETKFGTLTAGQQYAVDAMALLKLDMMLDTSFMGTGYDMGNVSNFVLPTGAFGYNYLSRNEAVNYVTPEMMGIKLGVSMIDKENDLNVNEKWNIFYAGYNKTMGANTLEAHLSYGMEKKDTAEDDKYWQTAVGFHMPQLTVSAMYGVYTKTEKNDITKMNVGAKYKMGKCALAVAYTASTDDNDGKENKQSQMAATFSHAFNNNLSVRLMAGQVKVEKQEFSNTDPATALKAENTAMIVGTGVTVNF